MTIASGLPDISISVTSGPFAVREVLDKLLCALRPLALSEDDAGSLELVMAEALNNIVEHAYPEGTENGPIHVHCNQVGGNLHMTVRDLGRAMPDGTTPVGASANVDVCLDDLPEGGFGWFLIKGLARDVQYTRVGGENRLTLHLALENNRPNPCASG